MFNLFFKFFGGEVVYFLYELYWYGFCMGIVFDYSWGICFFFVKSNDMFVLKVKFVWLMVVMLVVFLYCVSMKLVWFFFYDKVLSMVCVIYIFLFFDILLVFKLWDLLVWGSFFWFGEKFLYVFSEDLVVMGSVFINFLVVD